MFSVVIPAFNARATLARAVRSVLAQQGPGLELIVVDDGSTDSVTEALAGVADPRLRIVRQANLGCSAARNTGIEAASHPWVALLDADDLWLPGHLEELDRIRTAFPEAGLIGTAEFGVAAGAASACVPQRPSNIREIRYLAAVARGEPTPNASSAAVFKGAWDAVGRSDPAAAGPDRELWARLSLAWPVAVSDRITTLYLRAEGSDSDRQRRQRHGRPVKSLAELSSSVAMLLRQYADAGKPLRKEIDAYVLRYFDYRLREAIAFHDVVALRSLRELYPGRQLEHRLLLALSALPSPLATRAARLGLMPRAALQRLRKWRAREPHEVVHLPLASDIV
jgi:glycosyltransferase involved in cell wall biosynthesis